MRIIIAGSRDIIDKRRVFAEIEKACDAWDDEGLMITEVVCGMCRGVDLIGKKWAEECGLPVKEMPADWERLGKRAGHARNLEMAQYADAAIVIHRDTPGSRNMIKTAKALGLRVKEAKL